MIRLSAFSDEISPSLATQLEVLKKNNIKLIELRSIDGINIKDFTNEAAAAYKKQLDDAGVSVWSIGSPLGKVDVNTPFEEYEKTVRRVCELSDLFCTDKIRMFSFFNAQNEREKVISHLCRMVEIGREYGVSMYHENEKEIYGDTMARVLDLMENVGGLKFIYDPANFIQVGEKSADTLPLADKCDYFHIKDVIAETEQLVPSGYGDGDIKGLVSSINTDTTLTLEPHLKVFEGYASIDNSEMKNKFSYETGVEAFEAATLALKQILISCGYTETDGGFVK